MKIGRLSVAAAAVLSVSLSGMGCSDDGSGNTIGSGGSSSGGTSAGGSSSGGSSSGGSSSGGSSSGGSSSGGSSSGGSSSGGSSSGGSGGVPPLPPEFEQCAVESREAEALPVDIFIMLDQSTSMGDHTIPPGDEDAPTRWELLTGALKEFIQAQESAGLGVGLQYFGLPPTDETDEVGGPDGFQLSCDADDYANPEVEIGLLPDNADALVDSIDEHFPSNLTPSNPALEGALRHAKEYVENGSGRPAVVLFATDGYPTECDDTSIQGLVDLAKEYANPPQGEPRIPTFVVGLGTVPNLTQVARAGGTGDAYFVADADDATDGLRQALRRVASSPALCEFDIPEPPEGEFFDPAKVNMTFTPPGGAAKEIVRHVTDGAACGEEGGWYYDNNGEPTTIFVCPATCGNFGGGVVDIVVGCQTVSIE